MLQTSIKKIGLRLFLGLRFYDNLWENGKNTEGGILYSTLQEFKTLGGLSAGYFTKFPFASNKISCFLIPIFKSAS
jgi:hypothetical protein